MEAEKRPAQYIVRVWSDQSHRNLEFRPWAHSAEDAKFQIEFELKKSSVTQYVSYIGPVNPNCKCLNECRCGVMYFNS